MVSDLYCQCKNSDLWLCSSLDFFQLDIHINLVQDSPTLHRSFHFTRGP